MPKTNAPLLKIENLAVSFYKENPFSSGMLEARAVDGASLTLDAAGDGAPAVALDDRGEVAEAGEVGGVEFQDGVPALHEPVAAVGGAEAEGLQPADHATLGGFIP